MIPHSVSTYRILDNSDGKSALPAGAAGQRLRLVRGREEWRRVRCSTSETSCDQPERTEMHRKRNQGRPIGVDRIEGRSENRMPDRRRPETPTVRFSLARVE